MSFVSNVVFDNSAQRVLVPGDIVNGNEAIQVNSTAGAATLTVQQILGPILRRSGPGAGFNDTTPTAEQIIQGILQGSYLGSGNLGPAGVPTGSTWRLRIINEVAFAETIVAGTGVTLAGTTANAASSIKDYLFTILNGTPTQVFAATTTNASAVITGLTAAQTQLLSPGMAVTGTGIPGSTTVLSVQPGVGVTLSANATASGSLVALTFAPRVEMRAIGQLTA